MLCAGAVGGDELQALPAAAAVKILSIWTLVHDDVIDRDETRRAVQRCTVCIEAWGRKSTSWRRTKLRTTGFRWPCWRATCNRAGLYALLCDLLERGVSAGLVTRLVRRMAASLTPKLLEGEILDVQYSLRHGCQPERR